MGDLNVGEKDASALLERSEKAAEAARRILERSGVVAIWTEIGAAGETDANWGNAPVARNVGIEKRAANGFKAARRARRLDGERFSA